MKKNISLLLEQFHENFRCKKHMFRRLRHSSEMENDALMHHEGLKG